MAKTDREEVLAKLRALEPELIARYRVREIALFGSFVREEQGEASDIDVLVDFDEGADLFDLVGLGLFLEEELQREVDVVPKRALRPELRDEDALPLTRFCERVGKKISRDEEAGLAPQC